MKVSELKQIIMKELENMSEAAPNKPSSGRRFIPPTIDIPADIRNEFKSHFKLYKKDDGDETFSINNTGVDILKQVKASNSLPSGTTKNDIAALIALFKAGKEGKELTKEDYDGDMLDRLAVKGYATKKGGSEYKLYISPLMKVTLDKIERGRPGIDYRKTDEFIKQVTEKIPSNIRGLLKKYATKIDSKVGMIPVDTPIKDVTSDRTVIFYNPYTLE